MIHVGFTGTRHGMVELQRSAIRLLLLGLYRDVGVTCHHGDCIGADADFHKIARGLGFWVVGHIPSDDTHRAFCDFDEVREPLTYMKRNRAIVDVASVVLATPFEMTEQARGGTWSTIRMARRAGRETVVVLPDGAVRESAGI